MGRLFALLLVVAVACGDNQPGPIATGGNGPEYGGASAPVPRFVPEVCAAASWSNVISSDLRSEIAVVGTSTGAGVVAVPTSGGRLTGFTIDRRMDMIGTGTKIPIDETFSAVSLSLVADRFVTTAVDTTGTSPIIRVDLLDAQLGTPVEVAKLDGAYVAKPAFVHADGVRIVPSANDKGLALDYFDQAWNWVGHVQAAQSDPATGLAASQFGEAAMVAWSTASECDLMELSAYVPGTTYRLGAPCPSPRVAADDASGTAVVVFEGTGGIEMSHYYRDKAAGGTTMLRPDARAPRIVFDGTRYWVSYLDARGDVVVGFIGGDGQLVSMGLDGTQPRDGAYELVLLNGAPWVFALDGNGYSAQRLCIGQQ